MNHNDIFKAVCLIAFIIFLIIKTKKNNTITEDRKYIIDQCISLLKTKITGKRKDYKPNDNIYRRLQKDRYNEKALTALAYDILEHCGIKPAYLYVRVEPYNQLDHKAGMYQNQQNYSQIIIFKKDAFTLYQIISILVHECMHFYLRYRNIYFNDTERNEILTDAATIYMGFGEYTRHSTAMGIGYINSAEVRYIKDKVS